jgi:hypothetical protein
LHRNEYFGLDTDDTIDVLDVEVERNYSTDQFVLNLPKTTLHEELKLAYVYISNCTLNCAFRLYQIRVSCTAGSRGWQVEPSPIGLTFRATSSDL